MMIGLVPVPEGWLSQKYSSSHKGIDIGWIDTAYCDVRAWNDGEVISVGVDAAGANYAVIRHDNGQWSAYWHLRDTACVSARQRVKTGQKIGVRGKSGKASGVHLHFALTEEGMPAAYSYNKLVANTIDPLPWMYRYPSDKIEDMTLPVEEPEKPSIDLTTLHRAVRDAVSSLYAGCGYKVVEYSVKVKEV